MSDILVYENHDVFMQHPTRAVVPHDISTLENFLSFVSSRVAASSGDISAAGRYRFVYAIDGRPLWRANDCREAGVVVVSCTPGFLVRKGTNGVPSPLPPAPSAHASHAKRDANKPDAMLDANMPLNGNNYNNNQSRLHDTMNWNATTYTTHANSSLCSSTRSSVATWWSTRKEMEVKENVLKKEMRRDEEEVLGIDGRRVCFPPPPRFVEAELSGVEEFSPTERRIALHTLFALKLLGRPFFVDDLLFQGELNALLRPALVSSHAGYGEAPIRLFIEGPPKSGVSTSLAYAAYTMATCEPRRLRNYFFLPLNVELLFEGSVPDVLHDVSRFCLTIIRHTMDCVAAQRPSLRAESHILSEAWESLVVCRRDQPVPRFGGPRLARLVGHKTLDQWDAFAAAAAPIIRAAAAQPSESALRDVCLETMLSGFVAHIAAALRFSGVVYLLDGMRRCAGEAAALWRCLTTRPWAHVVAGLDFTSMPSERCLPAHVRRVRLMHLLSKETLIKRYGFPTDIQCGGRRFPIDVFLGVPGYLQQLFALMMAGGVTPRKGDLYSLFVDDTNVLAALKELAAVLQVDSTPC